MVNKQAAGCSAVYRSSGCNYKRADAVESSVGRHLQERVQALLVEIQAIAREIQQLLGERV